MNQLGEVALLAQHLVQADRKVLECEEALRVASEDARRLREEAIPGLMEELGLTELKLEDGSSITVGLEVYCSISEDRKAAAHAWLDANGFGGLIKTDVTVPFGRDATEELGELVAILNKDGYTFALKQAVHAGTLKAFLKEQIRDGREDLPLQLFGARPVTVAKVKLPKGK